MALLPAAARAVGTQMFATELASTGEKPQSKLWYHDGSYWGILLGPDGVAFYEKVSSNWVRGSFMDAVVSSAGTADVKWNGTNLFVLVYAGTSRLYKYSYETGTRAWVLATGFPVTVPQPSGTETMVLEQDSSGRLWTTTVANGTVYAYYSTSADHRTWSSTGVTLRTGINADDISSIVAFGGNQVGAFWSDQNRDEFGFRVHRDSDAPTTWGATEVVATGSGIADDHINLAFDSQGRVYAVTKDDLNEMRVHRRAAGGGWTTKTDVLGGAVGTRGIIMVAEADSKVYILYTRWEVVPERVEYRVADLSTLTFASTTTFISSSSDMNNVTGMKQVLPPGSLVAVAHDATHCWYNSFGSPPGGTPPPSPPTNLVADLLSNPVRVGLGWSAPSTAPDGYNVYRQENGGAWTKLNASLVTTRSYTDAAPPETPLCYHVRSVDNGLESAASNSDCVDNSPLPPPQAPQDVQVTIAEVPPVPAVLQLDLDEGSGQTAFDASGYDNHARLGSTTGADTGDPTWIAGVAGGALQFDGSNDYLQVADAASLDLAGSFTIEAWVRHDGGTGVVASKGNTSNQLTYRIRVLSDGDVEFRWETTSGSTRQVTAASGIADSDWHHLACVYDQAAGQNRIYVDGTLAASASASGTPYVNTAPVYIGARYSSNLRDWWNGALDGLRIATAAVYDADFTPSAKPSPAAGKAGAGGGAPAGVLRPDLRAIVTWQAPPGSVPLAGYHVYRSLDGGPFVLVSAGILTGTQWSDASLEVGDVCYQVTAENTQALEGPASTSACDVVLPPLLVGPGPVAAQYVALAPGAPLGTAAYVFEAASGQTFADATGQGHDGTLGPTTKVELADPTWVGGPFGAGLRFDGINDRATVPDAPELRLASGSFTLEAWVAADSSDLPACIASKGSNPDWALRLDAGGRLQLEWRDAADSSRVLTGGALADGTWHHVAAVHDAGAGATRLYVDGVQTAAAVLPAPGPGTSLPMLLGSRRLASAYGEFLLGWLDNLRLAPEVLYDAAFTPPRSLDPPPPLRVDLAWPALADAAGYNVYRQDGADWTLLNATPSPDTGFVDLAPPPDPCYRVAAVDTLGREGAPSDPACVVPYTTDTPDAVFVPAPLLALRAVPNPFNPSTRLAFDLPAAAQVRLAVFDVRGRRLATLLDERRDAGRHSLVWDGRVGGGRRLPSGIYFAVLETGGARLYHKLILVQ